MTLTDLPGVRFTKMPKGTVFIKQGDPVEYIYYLTSGYFYRIMTTVKGDEVIYSIKSASEDMAQCLIGVFCLYGSHSSRTHAGRGSSTDFVAMTDCEGYMISKEEFYAYANDNPELLSRLLDVILDEYVRLIQNYQGAEGAGDCGARWIELIHHGCAGDGAVCERCVFGVSLIKFRKIKND